MVTTAASSQRVPIHDRMPMVLLAAEAPEFLNGWSWSFQPFARPLTITPCASPLVKPPEPDPAAGIVLKASAATGGSWPAPATASGWSPKLRQMPTTQWQLPRVLWPAVRGVAVSLGLGFLRNKQNCQRPDLALEAFTCRITAGRPLIINGDGSQRRNLTHVSDVARAVELALRWSGPGAVVLNVGTDRNHSVLDMAETAAKTATPLVEYQAAHPADVPQTLASITAAGAQLGWQPRIFFPDGLISGSPEPANGPPEKPPLLYTLRGCTLLTLHFR